MQFVIPLQKPKKYVVKMTFTEPRKLQVCRANTSGAKQFYFNGSVKHKQNTLPL